MKIPLPKLMRQWREADFASGGVSPAYRAGLKAWAYFAKRPRLYHLAAKLAIPALAAASFGRGRFRALPFASGWTRHRDFAAPEGRTFQQRWAEHKAGVQR
jgi:L-lactate dehydrogenase complex protein LldF